MLLFATSLFYYWDSLTWFLTLTGGSIWNIDNQVS